MGILDEPMKTGADVTPEESGPQSPVVQSERWYGPDGPLTHTVTAGWTILRDDKDEPAADVFSVAYVLEHAPAGRPVTFVFNGGPGASSAYLHVGALGTRRVRFSDTGMPLPPPAELVDNHESWFAFTDLVFVDPVGTGWSRAVEDDESKSSAAADAASSDASGKKARDPKAYFGLQRDLDSLTEFISRWLSSNDRWTSPLYVAGESYGGYRAAKLARLCNERGMGLSGTILISPALEFALLDPSDYDVLPWIDLVPTMALAAHHHRRGRNLSPSATVDEVRTAAESFATGPLASVLIRGAGSATDEKARVVATLADFLGLDAALVGRHDCRISMTTFARELLRDRGQIVGLYDATAVGRDPFPGRDGMAWPDPTLAGIERVFAAGVNSRLRTELQVRTDREYRLLSMDVNKSWKIDVEKHALEHQVGATDDLRYGMAMNPHMKVFLCHGMYDMVTPFSSSERLRNQLRLDDASAGRITTARYRGGHMFYAWDESRRAFASDIAAFYAD